MAQSRLRCKLISYKLSIMHYNAIPGITCPVRYVLSFSVPEPRIPNTINKRHVCDLGTLHHASISGLTGIRPQGISGIAFTFITQTYYYCCCRGFVGCTLIWRAACFGGISDVYSPRTNTHTHSLSLPRKYKRSAQLHTYTHTHTHPVVPVLYFTRDPTDASAHTLT